MMLLQKILKLNWAILCIFFAFNAHAYDFFSQHEELTQDLESSIEETDLNQEQRHLAKQHDQEENDYKVLQNPFYSNERISIYNYTAYSSDDLKARALGNTSGQNESTGLGISFGYGMRYQLKPNQQIGYEFISSFPYDRGQMIRIFWNQWF